MKTVHHHELSTPQFERYIIVRASRHGQLAETVCGYLARGWIPVGGVAVSADDRLYQALVLPVRSQEK